MKQPTAPLYPELPTEDGQNYRLQKISEIEKQLITEREMQEKHCIRSIKEELILPMELILH